MNEHFGVFNQTITKSTLDDFREFLNNKGGSEVTKWSIYSDYCINDSQKLYNAMTFTVVPYLNHFEDLKNFLKDVVPYDLKKTKSINKEFCDFLKTGYVFNFSLIFGKGGNHFFFKASREDYIKGMDELIQMYKNWIVSTPQNTEYFSRVIKKINRIKQEMSRKTFNLALFQNIWITQFMVSYIMMLITRESKLKPEIIGWLSDRDNMVTAYDGIIYDLTQATYHNFCSTEEIAQKECKNFCVASSDTMSRELWFDEMIRVPDFISGALAGRNYPTDEKDKYDDFFELALIDNPFLAAIAFVVDANQKGVQRITFKHKEIVD